MSKRQYTGRKFLRPSPDVMAVSWLVSHDDALPLFCGYVHISTGTNWIRICPSSEGATELNQEVFNFLSKLDMLGASIREFSALVASGRAGSYRTWLNESDCAFESSVQFSPEATNTRLSDETYFEINDSKNTLYLFPSEYPSKRSYLNTLQKLDSELTNALKALRLVAHHMGLIDNTNRRIES